MLSLWKIVKPLSAMFYVVVFINAYLLSVECSIEHVMKLDESSLMAHHVDDGSRHERDSSSHKDADCCSDLTTAFFASFHATGANAAFLINPSNVSLLFIGQSVPSLFKSQKAYAFSYYGKGPPPLIISGFLTRLFLQSFQI